MKRVTLDAADIRILAAVQQHGKLSKASLAEIVNLSPTPCWTRLDKLKKAGLIRGYHADIALDKVADLTKTIVTISLKKHHKSDFERFESHIQEIDEVISCVATGGGFDYVLTIVSRNLNTFQALMESLLMAEIGIDRYFTYFVTREIKSTRPNLFAALKD
ncbi:MAG: Lrp/AsnC family transcriptional regulator [Thiolinea sp.]